jgi:hypothetical protein
MLDNSWLFQPPQTDWQEWAAGLKAIDIFTNEGIPGPSIYKNWQDWASALVGAINQPVI